MSKDSEPETIVVNRAPSVVGIPIIDSLPETSAPPPVGANVGEPDVQTGIGGDAPKRRKERADKGKPRGPRAAAGAGMHIPAGFMYAPTAPTTAPEPDAPPTRPSMAECVAQATAEDKKMAKELTDYVMENIPVLRPLAGVYNRCAIHAIVHYGGLMNPPPMISAGVMALPIVAIQVRAFRQSMEDDESEKTPVQETAAAQPDPAN